MEMTNLGMKIGVLNKEASAKWMSNNLFQKTNSRYWGFVLCYKRV
jgi:hypothetical protein